MFASSLKEEKHEFLFLLSYLSGLSG